MHRPMLFAVAHTALSCRCCCSGEAAAPGHASAAPVLPRRLPSPRRPAQNSGVIGAPWVTKPLTAAGGWRARHHNHTSVSLTTLRRRPAVRHPRGGLHGGQQQLPAVRWLRRSDLLPDHAEEITRRRGRRRVGAGATTARAVTCAKRIVIESRWVSIPPAFAGKLQPRRLNDYPLCAPARAALAWAAASVAVMRASHVRITASESSANYRITVFVSWAGRVCQLGGACLSVGRGVFVSWAGRVCGPLSGGSNRFAHHSEKRWNSSCCRTVVGQPPRPSFIQPRTVSDIYALPVCFMLPYGCGWR
jgi:hypothetical protein